MSYPGIFRSVSAIGLIAVVAGVAACAPLKPTPSESDRTEGINASGQGMEELFSGRFPGVEVYKAAGGGISIRIRGSNTLMGSSEPLYIIDGAKVQSGPGGLLFLDPNEIKRIEVLKDIGSTAVYGSEGANGVVIITTKRAR
jgi:TonB-dependent SusC/RagA subfamily outer membrane receptor